MFRGAIGAQGAKMGGWTDGEACKDHFKKHFKKIIQESCVQILGKEVCKLGFIFEITIQFIQEEHESVTSLPF